MALTDGPPTDEDDFADSDTWLAAEVRQVFRAHRAGDAKAANVALFYFDNYLTLTIRRQLHHIDPVWDGRHRCFDGLYAEVEFPDLNSLCFRGEVCWMDEAMNFYFEPVDFSMELCPKTGAFRRYTFRFGDSRPLSAKTIRGHSEPTAPVGGWAYVIERGHPEPDKGSDCSWKQ